MTKRNAGINDIAESVCALTLVVILIVPYVGKAGVAVGLAG
jgi:hypothetical protein